VKVANYVRSNSERVILRNKIFMQEEEDEGLFLNKEEFFLELEKQN